ncbi:MAG TPA: hypothetical protein VKK79_01145 [Candidatus Lokiarchaeia archaeon]|nr:hypothetical protein [Candidatus Lokiarchaeia archaeon]
MGNKPTYRGTAERSVKFYRARTSGPEGTRGGRKVGASRAARVKRK